MWGRRRVGREGGRYGRKGQPAAQIALQARHRIARLQPLKPLLPSLCMQGHAARSLIPQRGPAGGPRRSAHVLSDVAVIYLYRFGEPESSVRRFVDSYRSNRAGIAHRLYVALKGFHDVSSLRDAQALFDDLAAEIIEVPDIGYDIGSYRVAANAVKCPRLLFLNAYSRILAENWLAKFGAALDQEGVGLVGATGSWQSNASGFEWELRRRIGDLVRAAAGRRGVGAVRSASVRPARSAWEYVMAPVTYVDMLRSFRRHPNPHIRTNAFMIDRNLFLSLDVGKLKAKKDAYKFESGRRSLTCQVQSRGLAAVVVGRSGIVYPVGKWSMSRTLWRADQDELLIADRRTDEYAAGSSELRAHLEMLAWRDPLMFGTKGQA